MPRIAPLADWISNSMDHHSDSLSDGNQLHHDHNNNVPASTSPIATRSHSYHGLS